MRMGAGACQRLADRLEQADEAALIVTPCNRRYLTGFPSSDGAVLITREKAYLLVDFRYAEAAGQAVQDTFLCCREYRRLTEELQALTERHRVHRLYVEADGVTLSQYARLQQALPDVTFCGDRTLDGWLDALRRVKTPTELDALRQAQALTEEGFEHILSFIRPGRTEREVALELEFAVRRFGAEGPSFEFIVVSGANGSQPHGVPTDKRIETGELVTMDFGAMVDGYHADMTRTVAVGNIGDEERRVYDTVLRAQLAALDTLQAGVSCVQGDAAARDVIVAAGYGDCFGHGTGHGVGVEIHEQPRLSPMAGNEQLAVGNVVTVEPGVYLPGKCGVRIEDMVVITETGCENLTKAQKSLLVL